MNTQQFINAWNDTDVIISSVDIDGYNWTVEGRELIDSNNLNNLACRVKDDVNHIEIGLTAQKLIEYYLDDNLKVFQEVAYI